MSAAVQMRSVAPVLLVADVVKTASYYTEKLGFTQPRFFGEPPVFAILRRGELELMLSQVDVGDTFRPNGDYGHRIDVYYWVSDADALHTEFAAKGAIIVCPPSEEPYGMREFQVRDPDGHVLAFGHDISGAS